MGRAHAAIGNIAGPVQATQQKAPRMTLASTIDDLTAGIESELRRILSARQMDLYRMMTYHLGWEDELGDERGAVTRERSHGVACLTACAATGGDVARALPAAAAVELLSNFCEIHDDVQGGQPQRENRDAVWWVWGPAQAINAGDGMHALARLAVFMLQERGTTPEMTFRAVQMVDEASLELCEGRFKDLEAQERIDLSVDAYLEMAEGKTGSLFSCAMKLGALVAGAGEVAIESVGVCGAKLGVALQVRRDLRELWGDGLSDAPPSPEVLNKKKLLPVVYAIGKATIKEKRRLGDIYFKRVLEPDDVVSVRTVLEEMGSREFCETLIGRLRSEALKALVVPGVSDEGASALSAFAGSLLDS